MTITDYPPGLFWQVSSMDQSEIAPICRHIADHHKPIPMVLNQIGLTSEEENGRLHTNLMRLIPLLTSQVCSRLYIGSSYIKKTSDGDWAGWNGMLSETHRHRALDAQRELWRSFHTLYPQLPRWYPYIEWEGTPQFHDHDWFVECWIAYLIQSIRDFQSITGRNYGALWSPYFTATVNSPKANGTGRLIRRVKDEAPPGIIELALQDHKGQKNMTISDTVDWLFDLNEAIEGDTVLSVNVEQFAVDDSGGMIPAPVDERVARRKVYMDEGYAIGPCWEARWWYRNHNCNYQIGNPSTPTPPTNNGLREELTEVINILTNIRDEYS